MKKLLFLLLILIYGESRSQNTLTLNVDSIVQPFQTLDISGVDTLIVNIDYSLIIWVKPLSLDYDSASWFSQALGTLNLAGCDFSVDSTSFDCLLPLDTVMLVDSNYVAWKYYNIPDCKTFVVTHQLNNLYFILHKQNGCVVTEQETITNKANEISFFPNPSNGELNINLQTPGEYTLRMLNALGQLIYVKHISSGLQTIDLSAYELNAGLYFLEVFDQNQNRVKAEKWIVRGF